MNWHEYSAQAALRVYERRRAFGLDAESIRHRGAAVVIRTVYGAHVVRRHVCGNDLAVLVDEDDLVDEHFRVRFELDQAVRSGKRIGRRFAF